MIQRYHQTTWAHDSLSPDSNGPWVKYDDHIAERERIIEAVKASLVQVVTYWAENLELSIVIDEIERGSGDG